MRREFALLIVDLMLRFVFEFDGLNLVMFCCYV